MYFFRLLKVVLWSFFGVRAKEGHEADFKSIKPVDLLVAFLAVLILLAVVLVVVVKVVMRSHA